MRKCFLDPNALLAVAGMLVAIAEDENKVATPVRKPTRRNEPCGCGSRFVEQPRDEFGRFTTRTPKRTWCPPTPPQPRWGVCECEPREDKNKVFGLSVRVDEPTHDMFCTRARFLDARKKWDNLVDAVEAVDWQNKSNTAPLHKVNAVRRRIFDGPPVDLSLVGESQWWD